MVHLCQIISDMTFQFQLIYLASSLGFVGESDLPISSTHYVTNFDKTYSQWEYKF